MNSMWKTLKNKISFIIQYSTYSTLLTVSICFNINLLAHRVLCFLQSMLKASQTLSTGAAVNPALAALQEGNRMSASWQHPCLVKVTVRMCTGVEQLRSYCIERYREVWFNSQWRSLQWPDRSSPG